MKATPVAKAERTNKKPSYTTGVEVEVGV